MTKVKLQFFSDGGHGWLRVPVTMLKEFSIVKDITVYSYLRGRFAYLEEDCDANTFLNAAKHRNIEVAINYRESHNPSQIRRYPCYNPARVAV